MAKAAKKAEQERAKANGRESIGGYFRKLFRANPKTCIVLDLATGEIKPIIVPVPPKPSANV